MKHMKKIRVILSAALLLVLCAALYVSVGRRSGEYSETKFLFDTECTVRAGGKNAEEAVKAAYARAEELNGMFDYYSDSSVVSKINNADADEQIYINEDISAVLSLCRRISEASDGAFDITIASVKDLWHFNEALPAVPDGVQLQNALSCVNYKDFTHDKKNNFCVKRNNFTQIDLGGVAKGYAADAAAQVLKEKGAEYGIIDFGGNVVVFGRNPKNENGLWKVGIQKPFAPTGEYEEVIEASDCAIVTSGIYERNFTENGVLYHHILNPKTGYPEQNGLSSVTVIHSSSAVADALSTACFVLGEERGRTLAESFDAEIYFQYIDNTDRQQTED